MPRLFDELDALPEPGPLQLAYSSHMGEEPHCIQCGDTIVRPAWHLIPNTGRYSCEREDGGGH